MHFSAVASALVSAGLFGLSTTFAKLLIADVDPWLLAGLLYCGSGVGLWLFRLVRPALRVQSGAALTRAEWPWLGGAIFFGGVVGPILLMAGLARTEASTASLLLTLEGAATALIAWYAFRENFDRRIAFGMALIVAGAAVLSWRGTVSPDELLGPAAIVGACVAWGIDNNLTRKVSLADATEIAMLKGAVAGPVSLALAVANGAGMPPMGAAGAAGLVGFLGYGVSLVLFVVALRHLGTARTGAYYSTAPFLGAASAVLLLSEPVTIQLLAGGALMAWGVWLHLSEHHEHEHEPMAHSHSHVHDEHHRHEHGPDDPSGEPHVHWHEHERMRHTHAHVPDSHHRHAH